jgi:hypothetical protein
MILTRSIAFLALLPLAAGQSQVWTVGGSQPHFTGIQSAIDAAADGDTVLVRAGTYEAFILPGKGLSIVADTGALVNVDGRSEIAHVPPGSSVQLVGLRLRGISGVTQNTAALFARDCGGALRISNCSLQGGHGKSTSSSLGGPSAGREGGRFNRCDDVALCSASIAGGAGGGSAGGLPGGAGLIARDSRIALYDCNLSGGRGGNDAQDHAYDGGPGGHAYESPDALAFASGSSFQGGAGGNGGEEQTDLFGNCISAGAGGDGGHGIFLGSQPPGTALPRADLQSCSLAGGAGGFGGPGYQCANGPNGFPGQPLVVANGVSSSSSTPARKLTVANPVREATRVPLAFTGQPGDVVWLLQSLVPAHTQSPPFEGRLLVQPDFHSRVAFRGVVGANGQLAATLQLGRLPLGTETSVLHVQLLAFSSGSPGVLGTAVPLVIVSSLF